MKKWQIILLIIGILLGIFVGVGWKYYQMIYSKNIDLGSHSKVIIFIRTGASFEDVVDTLLNHSYLNDTASFAWVARKKNYTAQIKPGCYEIVNGMNNNDLLNMLRSGKQIPRKVTFNQLRTLEQLAGKIGRKLEIDSIDLIQGFKASGYGKKWGFDRNTFPGMFIPNTYDIYWTTNVSTFLDLMYVEYKKYWNDSRRKRAKEIGLKPLEVATLASIVQSEQVRFADERPTIAGLYMNRLYKGMALESDPTLIFAKGDFTIQRVLNRDKEVQSPYNTYKHVGLPPGPICIADIASLNAVLNYEENNYIFMCAKEDLSGRHNFAKTLAQHEANARKYRAALDKRGIKR